MSSIVLDAVCDAVLVDVFYWLTAAAPHSMSRIGSQFSGNLFVPTGGWFFYQMDLKKILLVPPRLYLQPGERWLHVFSLRVQLHSFMSCDF